MYLVVAPALPCCCLSYWELLGDIERRYASDITDLQQRLQTQVSTANRDKVQSYLERIDRVSGCSSLADVS